MPEQNFKDMLEADVVVKYINARFRRGLGTNILVIGLPGSGKSSTCFRVAELNIKHRPKENLEMFVVDSLLSLIDAIKKSKEGDSIVIEEVSVLFPSRRAMAKENVGIGKIFDTIRKKRLCLISNAPLWNGIESHIKSLADVLIQTLKVYKTEGVVVSKFYRIQTDPASGKVYRHIMTRNGRSVHRMITKMPNKERWDEYEKGKVDFIDNLYATLSIELIRKKEKEDKALGKSQPRVRDLTPRELEVHALHNVQGLTQRETAEKLGISQARVANVAQNIVKKTLITRE